jgi:hypothetical protein
VIRRRLAALTALVLLAVPAFSTSLVSGQGAGQGLEISPPLIELNVNPGDVKEVEIYVRNVTRDPLIVGGEVNDFVAAGEDGQPKLLLDESETSPFTIKPWVTNLSKVTIGPQERKAIKATMSVPKDASPGGHYGVIRFTGTPPELEDTGVSLSASVGTLMLVNVSGDVKEAASIAEIYTSQNDKKRNMFEYGPVVLGLRLKNDGNVHFKPGGTIRVTNMLGKEIASFQLNDKGSNVLPQSVRKFEQLLNKKLLFGRYNVTADIAYGSQSTIVSGSKTFWVIPYKLIALGIGIIALLIFLVRSYNRYILKRAQKKQSGEPANEKKNKKK